MTTTISPAAASGQAREVRAPRGSALSCRGWQQEAALRMLMNNLDPEVAEDPDHLVVYGGTGRAARSWDAFDAIVRELRVLAVEILAACQALDLLAPLTTSAPLARVHAAVRTRVPVLEADRPPSRDINEIVDLISTELLLRACGVNLE